MELAELSLPSKLFLVLVALSVLRVVQLFLLFLVTRLVGLIKAILPARRPKPTPKGYDDSDEVNRCVVVFPDACSSSIHRLQALVKVALCYGRGRGPHPSELPTPGAPTLLLISCCLRMQPVHSRQRGRAASPRHLCA